MKLPEWFGIRAEFELNVILYRMVGEANITYRDFLQEHAEHFAAYAEPFVVDYLRKPFGTATLLESVRSAAAKMCRGEPANLKRAFAAQ